MDEKYKIARDVIRDYIKKGKPFSYEEVKETILSKKGILRVSTGYTLGERLEDLEEAGIIEFKPKIDKFEVLKN